MSWWLIAGVVVVGLIVIGLLAGVSAEEELIAPPSAASDVGTTTVDDDWRALVGFYRTIGFFDGVLRGTRPDQAAEVLREATRRTWMRDLDVSEPEVEWMVLVLDEDRIWWTDRTLVVGPGEETYVETLAAWSRITRGALDLRDIYESWEGLLGPVRVHAKDGGEPVMWMPTVDGDRLDYGLLHALNQRLAQRGLSFWSLNTQRRALCLVVLSDDEVRAIERRGVELESLDSLLGRWS